MSYQHEHIPFLEPKDGYNLVADNYHTYHTTLNARDQSAVKKYLPRSLHGIHVLDLGGGDGRWAKILQGNGLASRTIVDVAQSMLDNAPVRTTKICADVRESLPLKSAAYELILSTFVLGHLDQISTIFVEARRCITKEGRMLLIYHYERRPYVHHLTAGSFKIKTWHRRNEEIEAELGAAGWEVDVFEVDEATKIFCCFPQQE